MAVVQISKIQVRRGQKNTGIGVPQLSSAEFAWAVDTQELFIGNGSVSEGAPYVGNTKVLTEHDNILELASSYRFASPDPSITGSVFRSLQGKLDEIQVSVKDFGAVGDGSTDNVEAFGLAFTDLFINTDANYRKVLIVPNGTYLFSSELKIPGTAIIRGETQEGAILQIGSNDITFTTETGSETFNSTTRPINVDISNITIQRTTGQMDLTGVADSRFSFVKFKGDYVLGDTVDDLSSRDSCAYWENAYVGTRVDNIQFDSCTFESVGLGIKVVQTSVFETSIRLENCKFYVCDVGTYISGVSGQKNTWVYRNTKFEEIANQAFISTNGRGTLFTDCDFKNCGNGINSAAYPSVEIVSFGESTNNRLVNCTSNRQQESNITTVGTSTAVAEVLNSSSAKFIDRIYSDIYKSDSPKALAVFPASNRYTYIEYTLDLDTQVRTGRLTISVNSNRTEAAITDEYQYSASLASSTGGILMTGFNFSVDLRDNDATTGIETVLLAYENPIATGATGTISFNVSYGV